jgi:predicted Zn finger-like uncharacterized protein
MKFTCDSCGAQYMISDDKVGESGVKVRCKKCGNVIAVRRAGDAPAAPSAPSGAPSGDGLDAELGSAFDSAFGDRPPEVEPEPAADGPKGGDVPAPAPLSTEWYVAIGEAQVGPLPIADVKRKWEQGDVGPDSLCWRPGMGDWSPLSTVAELASVLSPIPRAPARGAAPRGATPAQGTPAVSAAKGGTPAQGTPAVAPATNAAPDATWKPAGASALAALANDEIQARAAPAEPAKPAAKAGGVKSLVEQMNIADQGGVEPTGALPISIKGMERTDEKPLRRKSSVARDQEEIRQKRGSNTKVIVAVAAVVVAVVAAGAFGVITYMDKKMASAPAVAAAPAAAPAPAAPAAPAVAAATPPAEPAPSAAPAPAPPPEPAAAPAPAKGAKAAKGAKVAAAAPKAGAKPAPAPAAVAAAEPPPPPPPPAPKKKGDALLDFEGGKDDALSDALGGGGSGRSVYVPPKPGGSAAALPDSVTDGQVTEAIKGRLDSLSDCASKGAGGASVVMQWDISAEGGTRAVKCKAPCGDTAVGACLGTVIKGIRFPRSNNGRTKVEFPFKF